MKPSIEDKLIGCLVGGAIGDAMGLPFEGRKGPVEYMPPATWRVSDDTQLTLATCEAIANAREVSPQSIAESLLAWFRQGRIDGIGASTLKALRELDAGGHWALTGRKGEMAAGNGAAMRVAPLGFMLNPDDDRDRVTLRDICRITHHNEEAYVGALAVVAAIHLVAFGKHGLRASLLDAVQGRLPDSKCRDRIVHLQEIVESHSIQDWAKKFGCSGYVVESAPLAIAAVAHFSKLGFEGVLKSLVECGGDADTTASIAGQIAGAAVGAEQLPSTLLGKITDYVSMQNVSARLIEVIRDRS